MNQITSDMYPRSVEQDTRNKLKSIDERMTKLEEKADRLINLLEKLLKEKKY
nr:MAG TPA: hypothetical protein [Caudoviricetes sp.]